MRFAAAAACLRTNYYSLLPRRSRNPWFFTSDRQLPMVMNSLTPLLLGLQKLRK
jgi:hypothetical protein